MQLPRDGREGPRDISVGVPWKDMGHGMEPVASVLAGSVAQCPATAAPGQRLAGLPGAHPPPPPRLWGSIGLMPPMGTGTGGLHRPFPRWGRGHDPHGCPHGHTAPPGGFHNCVPPAAAGRDRAESGQLTPAPTMTWHFSGMAKPSLQHRKDSHTARSPSPAGPRRPRPRCGGSSAVPQFPHHVSSGTQSWVAPGTPTGAELWPLALGWRWPRRLPGWASSREWWPQGKAGTVVGHPRVVGRSGRAGRGYRAGAGSAVTPSPATKRPYALGSGLRRWPRATVTPVPSPS